MYSVEKCIIFRIKEISIFVFISVDFFNRGERNIKLWSCLKEDLVTELTESLANYLFPNMIDTTTDSVQVVASKLNGAEANHHLANFTQYVPQVVPVAEPPATGPTSLPPLLNISSTPVENSEDMDISPGQPPQVVRPSQDETPEPAAPIEDEAPEPPPSSNNTLESNTNTVEEDAEEENIDLPPQNSNTSAAGNYGSDGLPPPIKPGQLQSPQSIAVPNNVNNQQSAKPGNSAGSANQPQNIPVKPTSDASNQTTIVSIKPEPDNDQPVAAEPAPIYSGSGEEISGHRQPQSGDLNMEYVVSGDDSNGKIDATFSSGDEDENADDETSAEITVTPGDPQQVSPEKTKSTRIKTQQQTNQEKNRQKETFANSQEETSNDQKQKEPTEDQKPKYPYNTTNSSYPYVMPNLQYRKQQQQQQILGKTLLNWKYPTVQQNAYNNAYTAFSRPVSGSYQQQYYNPPTNTMYSTATASKIKTKDFVDTQYKMGGRRRKRRSIGDILKSSETIEDDKNILFSNPFWDIHVDHNAMQTRSGIARPKVYHKTLSRMINKRWLIPGKINTEQF